MPNSVQLAMGLKIVGYPALVASGGLVVARLLPAGSRARAAALALTAAAGLVTSHVGLAGKPPWPPVDSIGWIPIATLATALVLALVALVVPARARVAVTGGLLAIAALAAVYYAGKPTFTRSLDRFWPLAGLTAAGVVAAATLLPAAGERSLRPAPWLAWIAVAAGLAGCTLWSHSALLAMLLGSAATTAGVIGIGSAVLRIRDVGAAPAGVFLVHLAATAVYAHLYAKLPGWVLATALLAALAPIAIPVALGAVPGGAGAGAGAPSTRRRLVAAFVGLVITAGLTGLAARRMHAQDAAAAKDPASMYY